MKITRVLAANPGMFTGKGTNRINIASPLVGRQLCLVIVFRCDNACGQNQCADHLPIRSIAPMIRREIAGRFHWQSAIGTFIRRSD